MTLSDLKEAITLNAIPESFFIFQYDDNKFLVNQYIDELCRLKNCSKQYIQTLTEPSTDSTTVLFESGLQLYILECDTFTEFSTDYSQFTNIIVVCNKVDSSIQKQVEDYIIKFPKLQDWQIFDYIKLIAPELSDDNINWLIEVTKTYPNNDYKRFKGDLNGDIYRILNELDKILIFKPEEHQDLFNKIRYTSNSDLVNLKIFDLVDAILKNNTFILLPFLTKLKQFSFDPIAIVTLLLNNIKNALYVRSGCGANAGLNEKSIYAIKNAYRNYTDIGLLKAIDFLSNIDLKLKSSELDMTNNEKIDYIITHLAVIK